MHLNLQIVAPHISPYALCLKQHSRHFRLSLENQLSDFDNFWC